MNTALFAALIGGLVFVGLIAGQWWFMVHLLGQNGRVLKRIEELEEGGIYADGAVLSRNDVGAQPGLPVGSPAPDFSLQGLHGERLTLGALRAAGKPVVLLFTDPNCGPCTALLPEVRSWQRD